jgi:hypothetical protein
MQVERILLGVAGPRGARAQVPFLKGPVPLPWLRVAARLKGRALHVGIALWFLAGLEKSRDVRLAPKALANLGVDRHAGYRGLRALESAGLVSVERHRGRSPRVRILEGAEAS